MAYGETLALGQQFVYANVAALEGFDRVNLWVRFGSSDFTLAMKLEEAETLHQRLGVAIEESRMHAAHRDAIAKAREAQKGVAK